MEVKNVLVVWVVTLGSLFVFGCAKDKSFQVKPVDQDIRWEYAPAGIMLHLTGDEKLNWHGDSPSSLALCVYQLATKLPVVEMLRTPDGIEALLACERIDASVVVARRLFLDPGEQVSLVLDREEEVKFVVLVAGYHNGIPEGMGLLRKITVPPVPKRGWFSWLWGSESTKAERRPEQLIINLSMAESRMVSRPAVVEAQQ